MTLTNIELFEVIQDCLNDEEDGQGYLFDLLSDSDNLDILERSLVGNPEFRQDPYKVHMAMAVLKTLDAKSQEADKDNYDARRAALIQDVLFHVKTY